MKNYTITLNEDEMRVITESTLSARNEIERLYRDVRDKCLGAAVSTAIWESYREVDEVYGKLLSAWQK